MYDWNIIARKENKKHKKKKNSDIDSGANF